MSSNIVPNTKELKILESKVTNFLGTYAVDDYTKFEIAPHVAKTSLMPNHLYQDLGLSSRIHMGKYMKEYFPVLAQKKPEDKLWKKFIYDSIGEVAPACEFCKDQVNCFSCKV
jgi:nitrogen fixation protein NifQ